ncbi:MAG: hypothetical protein ABL903_17635 [Methylococcales bacterium]
MFSISLANIFEMIKLKNGKIIELMFVCPPEFNESRSWQMMRILEVYEWLVTGG